MKIILSLVVDHMVRDVHALYLYAEQINTSTLYLKEVKLRNTKQLKVTQHLVKILIFSLHH